MIIREINEKFIYNGSIFITHMSKNNCYGENYHNASCYFINKKCNSDNIITYIGPCSTMYKFRYKIRYRKVEFLKYYEKNTE